MNPYGFKIESSKASTKYVVFAESLEKAQELIEDEMERVIAEHDEYWLWEGYIIDSIDPRTLNNANLVWR